MARHAQQVDHPLHVQQPHRQSQPNCSLPITKGLTSCFPGTFHWAGSARSFGACGSYSRLSGCGMTCGALSRPQPSAAPQLTRVMLASPKLLYRWRWLAWAWINCVCFSIEIMCKKLFKARAEQGRERGGWASALRGSRYYRVTVALAAAFNILCLITVSAACVSLCLCLRELLSQCFSRDACLRPTAQSCLASGAAMIFSTTPL